MDENLSRIVGGESAHSDTWSWTVFLRIRSKRCGGSIIAPSWILTAAHCLNNSRASQITVYAGSHEKWKGNQIRNVSTIVRHPGYNDSSNTFVNDIALLHLSTPLIMTDPHVSIICLPSISSSVLSTNEWPPAETTVSDKDYLNMYSYEIFSRR